MSRRRYVGVLSPLNDSENAKREVKSTAPDDVDASPMTTIVNALDMSTISSGDTPTRCRTDANLATYVIDEISKKLDFSGSPVAEASNHQTNQRLFKNAFKLTHRTHEATVRRSLARRLVGMTSQDLTNSEIVLPSSSGKENGFALRRSQTSKSSPRKLPAPVKSRAPLEDWDPNSQDSGYGTNYPDKDDVKCQDQFRFAEPLGVAPRRSSAESGSPLRSPHRSPVRNIRPPFFNSLSSGSESMDDGFTELVDMENLDEDTQLPCGLSSLLSGQIMAEKPTESELTTPEGRPKPSMRRSLSLQNENVTPQSSKVRSCLFRSPTAICSVSRLSFDDSPRMNSSPVSPPPKSFKRPEPPTNASPAFVKRSRKSNSLQDISEKTTSPQKPSLQRCFSETEAHALIKSAIHRSTTDADLTGDFSKQCILPLAEGQHEDLKSISSSTLAALIRGEFTDRVRSFKIVDCRYPYEFEGGHVEGALNLFSKDMIEQHLLEPLTNVPEIQSDAEKRDIVVFHCEFSWERGPNLSRFLRNIDRQRNKEHYPALHYPEVYLLHGGYQQFYNQQKELCSPQGYRPMRHPDHEADLRQFRSKSKSWQGEKSRLNSSSARTNLKRLGL
ncbi:M-phase inducer phosphatase isoform X1 [Neodiprion lecontei]|uniref:protein-tyrosine-phosphatase n=2 Tax=Neodiprion lecontei TaxID=441921 RepID=A0ABM3GJ71_NEOLC|nr:M-phase inducer phosphatase isoform X1 [Neodiprion lecontei]XP_046600293.1 M-phase inducer phosphatase isoform X1 [Neodiprion lecontei]XP_046600294.1 M-phase inducer phosphatase isoform X1 [Neodiprion lecontei]XP_046600295.1 M-phase inducer phosphatase isoform X1 [Neodiprion lecontei]